MVAVGRGVSWGAGCAPGRIALVGLARGALTSHSHASAQLQGQAAAQPVKALAQPSRIPSQQPQDALRTRGQQQKLPQASQQTPAQTTPADVRMAASPEQSRTPVPDTQALATATTTTSGRKAVAVPPDQTPAQAAATAAKASPGPADRPTDRPADQPAPRKLALSAVRYNYQPPLVFPAASEIHGESGLVILSVLVDERGNPGRVVVRQSSGYPRLDQAALAWMRAARFEPYREDGVPRPFTVDAPVRYDPQ
jgi:periplasmic protein TonB